MIHSTLRRGRISSSASGSWGLLSSRLTQAQCNSDGRLTRNKLPRIASGVAQRWMIPPEVRHCVLLGVLR
jgi:hypothetical protein